MENNFTYATGRRKTSTARVYLTKGKGIILVNDLPLEEYFGREVAKILVKQPLVLLDMLEKFDIKVKVSKATMSKNIESKMPAKEEKVVNEEISNDNYKKISSPIIGTAYLAPEPGGKKFIEIGQKIKKGQVVGTLGQSGRATGPHLDIRLNWFNVKLDPKSILK